MSNVVLSHGRQLYRVAKKPTSRRRSSPANEILLVLVKLKCGVTGKILLELFECVGTESEVIELLKTWIPFTAEPLEPLLPNPSQAQIRAHLPAGFRGRQEYRATRIILDCSEFEVKRPSALGLNAMFYSDYKGRTTIKVLFGITPDGCISFVSRAYPGAISNNAITTKSGVLDQLERGDLIMADKGFTISNSVLQPLGLELVHPPFRIGQGQFSKKEVQETRAIANLRIAVENAIGRVRYFRIPNTRTPAKTVGLA